MLKRTLIVLTALLGLSLTAGAQEIVVGGKNFTEQQIMAEMTAQLLRAKGYEVEKNAGMGSSVLRAAQENGQIDVYWEYTGTGLIVHNGVDVPPGEMSSEEIYNKVKEMDAEKGLVWLEPSDANNTYALAMQAQEAEQMGIQSLSDLAQAINDGKELVFASNAEFYAREDGLRPLQETYGFRFPRPQIKRMDSGLTYQALNEGQVDIALVFATDGRIPAFNFKVLEDDKQFFPAYALTPVVREQTLEQHPELADILNQLASKLDDETMARLNAQVDVERRSIENVSESFLREQGLI
ncbi:MAG: glycine betaine ABC transporter substrate-binding protein [Candidatus Competibacterales bacterium]|nr:glycine betaine ABC transporter substrate-binding protein [Candidatus Competibacterales bacterium]